MPNGSSAWTPEEEAILQACYPRVGAVWDGWEALLPDRSADAIRYRAYLLGLHCGRRRTHHKDLEGIGERAAVAVAALEDHQRNALALLLGPRTRI